MKIKRLPVLWISLFASLAVVFVADRVLRSRSGWINQPKSSQTANLQPFMAERLLTEKTRAYLLLDDLKPKIQNAKTDDQRAELLLQAARLMKKTDPAEQITFLRRVIVECPKSPKIATAWVRLIDIKLDDKKNRDPPTEEVTTLIRIIQEIGIGPDKIDAKIIENTINNLKNKKFKELAGELAEKLKAASP